MKLMSRTLAILAAALAVAGVTLALSQSSTVQGMFPARRDHHRPQATTMDAGAAENGSVAVADPARAESDEHEDRKGPSLFGAVEIIKNLVVIGIIVALVTRVPRLFSSGRRKEGGRPQSPPAAPSV